MFDVSDQLEAIQRQDLQDEPDAEDVWRAMQEMERVQVWCEDKLQSLICEALDVEDEVFVAFVKEAFEQHTQDTRQVKTKQSANHPEFEALTTRLYEEAVELAQTKEQASK